MSGQLRSTRDIEEALQFVLREMVQDPVGMTKDGVPRTIYYVVIKDAMRELLERRSDAQHKAQTTYPKDAPTNPGGKTIPAVSDNEEK